MADSRAVVALARERNRLREAIADLELEVANLRFWASALPAHHLIAAEKKLDLLRHELVELSPRSRPSESSPGGTAP